MRRAAYHVAIRVALVLGRIQVFLAKQFRSCHRPHHTPYALVMLLLWLPFRFAFVLSFRLAFALADGLPYEDRL
jgi:hypothetical protein